MVSPSVLKTAKFDKINFHDTMVEQERGIWHPFRNRNQKFRRSINDGAFTGHHQASVKELYLRRITAAWNDVRITIASCGDKGIVLYSCQFGILN